MLNLGHIRMAIVYSLRHQLKRFISCGCVVKPEIGCKTNINGRKCIYATLLKQVNVFLLSTSLFYKLLKTSPLAGRFFFSSSGVSVQFPIFSNSTSELLTELYPVTLLAVILTLTVVLC